ncbi:MAG: hypothetical protein ABJM98_05430, partial [Ekhidna sp.]
MCKSCYTRVATAELNGPGYERVEGDSLSEMTSITERQLKFLTSEYLPVPKVHFKHPESGKISLQPTSKLPVRYLMPKLHKEMPAFR